jgi:hypothetical protein
MVYLYNSSLQYIGTKSDVCLETATGSYYLPFPPLGWVASNELFERQSLVYLGWSCVVLPYLESLALVLAQFLPIGPLFFALFFSRLFLVVVLGLLFLLC